MSDDPKDFGSDTVSVYGCPSPVRPEAPEIPGRWFDQKGVIKTPTFIFKPWDQIVPGAQVLLLVLANDEEQGIVFQGLECSDIEGGYGPIRPIQKNSFVAVQLQTTVRRPDD